jgi:hypothetical protein
VDSAGGAAFDVKQIRGGFAAITSITSSLSPKTGRLRTSYDGGKTWQPIEAGPQEKVFIDSIWRTWDDRPRMKAFMTPIIQVGENLFCVHPDGIFRSADKGKTWQLSLPSVKGKVLHVFVSGNVIYAVSGRGGC